jgi:hypothetical protein
MSDDSYKAGRIQARVEQFIRDQRIRSPETIYQTDRVIEGAYEFIQDLADIAGYWRDPEECDQ